MEEVFQAPQVAAGRGSETMMAPQEVQKMLALQALGWGAKRISRELGCSRNTVRWSMWSAPATPRRWTLGTRFAHPFILSPSVCCAMSRLPTVQAPSNRHLRRRLTYSELTYQGSRKRYRTVTVAAVAVVLISAILTISAVLESL